MKIIPNKFNSFFSNGWYKNPLKLFFGCFFIIPLLVFLLPYLLVNAIKMPKAMKIIGYILVTFALLLWIASTAPEDIEDTNTDDVIVNYDESNNTESSNMEISAETKEDFISFYNQILDLDNAGKGIYNSTTDRLKLVASGEINEAQLLVDYKNAQDQVYENSTKFKEIEIDNSLLGLEDELEDIKGRASLAHFAMSESLRLQLEYLNTNDLTKFQEAEKQSQLYSDIMKEVTIKLIEISKQAGVNPMDLRVR